MASSMKLFFLFFLSFSFSFSRTQAREGRFFFDKTTRPADPTEATPTAEKIDGPTTTLPPQSQHGYGLYGRGPEQFSPSTTAQFDDARHYNTRNNLPSKFPNTELTSERYDEKNNNMERNNFNNRYDDANDKFDTERGRRYGMSDTRFLDNGRYYYDVNAERSYDHNGNNQKGYGVYDNQGGNYNKRGRYGDEAYGYGNSKEYDNGAVEDQNNQENREEYVP